MNIAYLRKRPKILCPLAIALLSTGLTLAAKAAPTATDVPADWTTTQVGQRSEYVRTLQYLLRAHGAKVNADGIFGAKTKSAVTNFQRAHHLKVDGIAGGQTWKALVVSLKRGSRGDAVRALQNQLPVVSDISGVAVDGKFGRSTEAAVKHFQSVNRLKADGIVGVATWAVLFNEPQGD